MGFGRFNVAVALVVAWWGLAACGSDDAEGTNATGGTAGTGGGAGTGGSPVGGSGGSAGADAGPDPGCALPTVTFNLTLRDFAGNALESAKVTPSHCRQKSVTSDAKGSAPVELPTSEAAWVEIEHADTLPTLIGRIPLKQTLAFAAAIPPKALEKNIGYSSTQPAIWPMWWLPFAGAKLDRTGFVMSAAPGSFAVTYLDASLSPISGATACDETGGAVLVGGAEGDVTLSVTGGKFTAAPNLWLGTSAPAFIKPGWVTRVPIVPQISQSDAGPPDAPPPPPPDAGGD
ncbi:MAG: hypothetical protein HYZ29_12380 [Myxococcales bacterium]|nr:hypothetical protein [Myxococcales bacterium]